METEISKEVVYSLSKESFGLVPGIIKEMAERSVSLAYMYLMGTKMMRRSSLTEVEINVIELKISLLNECESCARGHSFLAKKAGLSDEDVQSILNNRQTSNERLNVLLRAAEYIYFSGSGPFPEIVLNYFYQEDIDEQIILEIIGLISLKTMSNFVNNYLSSVKRRETVPIRVL